MFEGMGAGVGLYANLALNLFIVGITIVFVFGVLGAVFYFYFLNFRRYKQFECIVFQKDAFGNVLAIKDDGAIFEKGKYKRFWLRKGRVSLEADNVPFILVGKKKTVFLVKKGTKNYVFVDPTLTGYDELQFNVGEEDINWGLVEFANSKESFGQSWFMQFAPYALVVFSIMIVFIVTIMLLKKFDVMVEISRNLGGAISQNVV